MIPSDEYRVENFPRIINEKHFNRLHRLLEGQNILIGGGSDPKNLQIDFTLVDEPHLASPLMQEEVFGPILPVYGFDAISEAESFIKKYPKPLALYLLPRMLPWKSRSSEIFRSAADV